MKQEIAIKWAEALESGRYKQAPGYLRSIDRDGRTVGFCCLGVLCNLHAQEHPELAATETDPRTYLGSIDALPNKVQEWADFNDPLGEPRMGTITPLIIINGSRYFSLAEANDDGVDFRSIAGWIRANYHQL